MFLRILFIALALIMTTSIFAQTQPPIETGVSQTLAKWRSANYSDVRYRLNITLEKGAPLMTGDIEIRVKLTGEGAKNDLILDWRTTQFANDKDKPSASVVAVNDVFDIFYSQSKEHIIIPKGALKAGENVIKINFASPIKTSGAAVTRYVDKEDNAEYIYSLFVPSDANTAFPVFDQPDLKARFSFSVYKPDSWKAKIITNIGTANISSTRIGYSTYAFDETVPISTYVFAFAIGEFSQFLEGFENPEPSDRQVFDAMYPKGSQQKAQRLSFIYVRKSQAEKFKQHAAEVFRLNREGVKFLEDWFDYKFPFPKYDLVLIPEFPFGGMEHAGATFLREDRVIFPTEPTKNDYITRANVIFHEAAHQWFGDTVTMKWFDDLWLKEGFAEFMAYKTLAKVMPEYNAWKIFYERNKQAAYLTDVTRGTTPIYQEIPNLSSAKSAYGNIVYRKAPSFLRQAEFYLGEDKFQTAVRAFLKKHEFANAEWTDLVKEFETASKYKLKNWSETWVQKRGLPKVSWKGDLDMHNGFILDAKQEDILGENQKWEMLVKFFVIGPEGKRTIEPVLIRGNDTNNLYVETKLVKSYKFVFPNYQDYGYGIFLLDEKSRAYVLENIQNEKDDFLRSMMWGSLWDSVRFYELAPEDYVKLVIKNLNVETDESTIATLLNRTSTAMNYYLNDKQRDELAPQIENLLLNSMAKAATSGQQITFYRALLNIASTDTTKKILKDIFNNNGKISVAVDVETKTEIDAIRLVAVSLPLKAKDKFDIITKLITLGDADGLKLLAELEKTETDDAAKRYAYAARAGIPTAENKLKYWKDFTENKEISESWIEAAFNVWNTPRHSELTLPYLDKALAELPNLKKNRKIFFVNGWLSAFIGGQKSEEALNIVNKFLADNPNLDKDLQRKILENSDNLERAVNIRKKGRKGEEEKGR